MSESNNRIWVRRALDRPILGKRRPLLASILFFGLPLNGCFILFYVLRHAEVTAPFIIASFSALLWLNLGPFFIWYYSARLMPRFFEKMRDIVEDKRTLDRLEAKYQRLFARGYWVLVLPLLGILFGIFFFTPLDGTVGGFRTRMDPIYWIGGAATAWTALLGGIGFFGVVVTLLVVYRISQEEILIDPLHPDDLGGIGCVGTYAIGTTILFSTGSLFLPAGFLVASSTSVAGMVYVAVFVFSGFILFSFLYPTILIHNKAKSSREKALYRLWRAQRVARETAPYNADEIARLRVEYDEYRSVNLYPFETRILAELSTSVLLPLAFLLLQVYVFKGA